MAARSCASFSDFLADSQTNLGEHLVFGNEAGDADSIVSALALAYVDALGENNAKKTPIVSIPRADMCLRRETVLLLEMSHVDTDKLVYIDDDLLDKTQVPKTVTLVDHNRLTLKKAINNAWKVVEIVDHHYDEENHDNVKGFARNIAFENNKALVASTCTLVAERLFASSATSIPTDLSLALVGVILLDTVNMEPKAGKVTDRDRIALNALLSKTDWSTMPRDILDESFSVLDTDKLFRRLSGAKFDREFWNGLSVRDALRLDYKRFQAGSGECFGASSILLDMPTFLSKSCLEEEVAAYVKEADVPLLAVLSNVVVDNWARRELLLCGSDKLVNSMANYLTTNPEAKELLQLKENPLENKATALTVRYFSQGNPKASRKQVAPVMLNFFNET